MQNKDDSVNLEELSRTLREARERKGWTLEQLSYQLWAQNLPTAQNKLWRLENNPPKRLDRELILWLERLLEVQLLPNSSQVLVADVLELLDAFLENKKAPARPHHNGLAKIYDKAALLKAAKG